MHGGRLAILLSGIEREYQREISTGIQAEAQARGYSTYFFCCQGRMDNAVPTSEEAEADIFRLPDLSKFDGAIVLRATIANPLALMVINDKLKNAGSTPLVFIDEHIKGQIGVGFEDAHCVQDITEHFITVHGARKLCFVSGQSDNLVSRARQREFEQTLQAHGLHFAEDQLFCGDYLREGGARAAQYFIREGAERPDAIVCANDDMALGLCETLMQNGIRIPEDIGVAGFDSIAEASELIPTLTTVRRPVHRAGIEAVRLLDGKLRGIEPPEWTALPDEIIYGQSCGCGHADDNQKELCIRRMNRKRNEIFNEYARANVLAKRLSGIHNYQDFRSRMAECTGSENGPFIYVAAMDEQLTGGEGERIEEGERGYSPDMRLIYGRNENRSLSECRFMTDMLFPPCSVPQSAVLCPLHADGRNFGYVATPLSHTNHFTVYTLLPSLGNALENLRLHNTIREYADALERMYVHDSLTGLLNRRGYIKYAEEMYREAAIKSKGLMIICADIDALKAINDTYGHSEGDVAIRALADCIQRAASSRDLCIHLSGDEFMVMGLDYDDEGMQRFIRGVESEIERHNAMSGKPYKLSASFGGYVAVPDSSVTLEQMSSFADDEMYKIKKHKHVAIKAGESAR